MKFWSTNGKAKLVNFKEALFCGLAPDGGLYMPERFPRGDLFEKALGFFTGLPDGVLRKIIREAFNFPAPLVRLDENLYVLELFHSPTLSFKDFGARFMARTMDYFLRSSGEKMNIITATSGDTGSAVASGFYGLKNVKVFVLYPSKRISNLQEKQIATLGKNVVALEVRGDFDDCQRLAKMALADEELRKKMNLSSANSINIGRLLPQMVYYFEAQQQLQSLVASRYALNPVFVVPSGNFGNLTAGLFAKKIGLPVRSFVAAVNKNSAVPDFLETGKLKLKKTRMTYSSAMDVGVPSNWARVMALYKGDINKIKKDISVIMVSEEETMRTMKDVYEKYHYVCDPHTAVGITAVLRDRFARPRNDKEPFIVLATAHPAKFKEVVRGAIGKSMDLPQELKKVLKKNKKSVKLNVDYDKLKEVLLKRGAR